MAWHTILLIFFKKIILQMMNSLKKNAFLLIVLFATILIKIVEWRLLLKKFIPNGAEGNDYDILDYTRLFFVSLHQLFLFTDICFILVLSICLLFKNKIETGLVRNIYYSLTYLFISIAIIQIIF
jgi:hypothetical protein